MTYLDAAVIAVCLISALLAMYRGLTRELLSIVSWIAAALLTFYVVGNYKNIAEDMARQMGTPVEVAQAAIGATVFVIVLIIVHLATARMSDALLESQVGVVDRVLGFTFGLARGFLLVVIPYMFYIWFFPDETTHFTWVRDAASTPYLKSTGTSIHGVIVSISENLLQPALSGQQTPTEAPAQ